MNRRFGLNKFLLCLIAAGILVSGCAITHTYGPYKGKVVDKETNEPIEGAVVFIKFSTDFQLSPGGPVSHFVDAVEVMTDQNGEFEIPRQRINTFRIFHVWDKYAPVIIFKPGYGAYPRHSGTEPHFGMAGGIPVNEYVTIKLPKLKTREERAKNVSSNATFTSDIPIEKWEHLFELRNVECKEIGIEPWPRP
jgi:hypothetical protein